MSTTDRIESLLKSGVMTLTIGKSPNNMLFISATQGVQTGAKGNFMKVEHQAEAVSLTSCFDQITRQVDHANEIKPTLVALPSNGRK